MEILDLKSWEKAQKKVECCECRFNIITMSDAKVIKIGNKVYCAYCANEKD